MKTNWLSSIDKTINTIYFRSEIGQETKKENKTKMLTSEYTKKRSYRKTKDKTA